MPPVRNGSSYMFVKSLPWSATVSFGGSKTAPSGKYSWCKWNSNSIRNAFSRIFWIQNSIEGQLQSSMIIIACNWVCTAPVSYPVFIFVLGDSFFLSYRQNIVLLVQISWKLYWCVRFLKRNRWMLYVQRIYYYILPLNTTLRELAMECTPRRDGVFQKFSWNLRRS